MFRRVLTIAGILVVPLVGAWALSRRRMDADASPDATHPLGYGSAMRRLMNRANRALRGGFGLGEIMHREDRAAIPFDWSFGTTEADVVDDALGAERISADSRGTAPDERDFLVTDKLTSAGMHLDQESGAGFSPVPRLRYVGAATPHRLMKAVERALDTTHSGVIVDTTRGSMVEIDEHRDVGKGNVVLIDSTGSRVLRHGTTRVLLQALRDVADQRPVSSSER